MFPSKKIFSYIFLKQIFFLFLKTEPCPRHKKIDHEKISYISGNRTQHFFSSSSKNKKNQPWENFLYFRKQNPPKNFLCFLKRKLFLYFRKRKPLKIISLEESLRAFHHCFFAINFYNCFRVFSLLIAFFHFTNFRALNPYFFRIFISIAFRVFSFHPLSLPWLFFSSGTSFSCCWTASATDFREPFLTLRRFLP